MAKKSMLERLAEEDLRDYQAKAQAIITLGQQIKRYEHDFTAIRSAAADSTPVSGGTNTREDAMIDNIGTREFLKAKQDEAKMFVRAIDTALEVLDPRERLIIDRMYIGHTQNAVERLKAELNLEQSQIYFYRDIAMSKFRKAYFGV